MTANPTPDSWPDLRDIAVVGIPVADQERALRFYSDVLGFEVRVNVPLPELGSRWIMVAPHGASVSIALVAEREGVPSGVETGIRFSTSDAEATHAALEARGVRVGEVLRWPGVPPMFAAHDVDGNRFEIVE
jgi:lactoylglutathione lyase